MTNTMKHLSLLSRMETDGLMLSLEEYSSPGLFCVIEVFGIYKSFVLFICAQYGH